MKINEDYRIEHSVIIYTGECKDHVVTYRNIKSVEGEEEKLQYELFIQDNITCDEKLLEEVAHDIFMSIITEYYKTHAKEEDIEEPIYKEGIDYNRFIGGVNILTGDCAGIGFVFSDLHAKDETDTDITMLYKTEVVSDISYDKEKFDEIVKEILDDMIRLGYINTNNKQVNFVSKQ